MKKAIWEIVLDFAASVMCLSVDWDNDFDDDEYVIERRRKEIRNAL